MRKEEKYKRKEEKGKSYAHNENEVIKNCQVHRFGCIFLELLEMVLDSDRF